MCGTALSTADSGAAPARFGELDGDLWEADASIGLPGYSICTRELRMQGARANEQAADSTAPVSSKPSQKADGQVDVPVTAL